MGERLGGTLVSTQNKHKAEVMPQWVENVECFYRHQDGEVFRVNFGEELYYKGTAALTAVYGGDGTMEGSGRAFFDSLKDGLVVAKRLVQYKSKEQYKEGAHETIAHRGELWESLSAKCAEGSYSVRMHGMKDRPAWLSPYTTAVSVGQAAEPVVTVTQGQVLNTGPGSIIAEKICPLSYFGENGPHKGDPNVLAEYKGAEYSVTNEDVKATFLADPEKYLPQFGGFCATGLSHGKLSAVEWSNFKVSEDGKLFLFMKAPVDAKQIWEQDEASAAENADKSWETLKIPYEVPPESVLPPRTELVRRAGRPAGMVGF